MLATAAAIEQQRRALEFAGLGGAWSLLLGLLLLVGVCYFVVWLYRREARVGAGARLRMILAAVRCLVLVGLALVWLEPVVATYNERTTSARVAVLADVSASMWIEEGRMANGEWRMSRVEQVVGLLEGDDGEWLRRLAEKNELALYTFGAQTQRLALPWEAATSGDEDGAALQPLSSSGALPVIGGVVIEAENVTDVGQAVAAALDEAGQRPLAGVIVLSDGGFNSGLPVAGVAATANRRRAPVYAVGVGAAEEPPNLRVTNVAAPVVTPRGDPFELRVELAAAGLAGGTVDVELTVQPLEADRGAATAESSADVARRVATRRVQLGGEDGAVGLTFQIEAAMAGEFLYRVRATPLVNEAIVFDNVREASVQVLDERIRVLLVSGRPSYEYRYLTRLLERDATVELSCWLQSADARAVRDGNAVITELPRRPENVFAYDVVLLLDANPAELDSSWAVTVRRLVDEFGGGLLFQAGSHYATRFLGDSRLSELIATLPVLPDPDADVRLSEQGAYRTRATALQLPVQSRGHPLVSLDAEAETNVGIWSALPGVWWYLPVLREKPVAQVLLRHAGRTHANRYGQAILMAVQPFGAGRAAFLGFDNTWRWRATGERYFNRFWVQMVRYLAQARRQGVSKRGTINLDRETVNVGDYVKIEARVLDESFVPWQAAQIETDLEFGDGGRRALALHAVPGREGWFAARVPFDRAGPALVRVPLPRSLAPEPAERDEEVLVKHVLVQQPDVELRSLRLREDLLVELAERTGGRYVALADAGELPEWIESATQVKVTRGADTPLWDRGPVLILIAALLALEWALRRRHHLL